MTINLINAIADLKQTGEIVKSLFVERDEVIDLALMAIAAESNMFLIGLPGVAKSAVINSIFDRIDGARIGNFTLTKGSVPDTLTGPVDVEGFRQKPAKWRVSTDGMLPDVHFAYISEVFKGNDLTRNAVLQVLNERQFFNGGEKQDCPLLTCAADSNEFPDFRETAAFYDRFLIRYQVNPISDANNLMSMVRNRVQRGRSYGTPERIVTLEQIALIHEARRAVRIPDAVAEAGVVMIREINAANHDAPVGDRRFGDTFDLVAARAVLDRRDEATLDDLIVFAHTAWTTPEGARPIQEMVMRTVAPELADLAVYFDEVEDAYGRFVDAKTKADQASNATDRLAAYGDFANDAQKQIDLMRTVIAKMNADGKDITAARNYFNRAKGRLEDASRTLVRPAQNDDVI